jgi:DNA-binding response OmpR family regulator
VENASTILIVEDEVELAQVLRDYLESRLQGAARHHGGGSRLDLSSFMADLVADLNLPGLDG